MQKYILIAALSLLSLTSIYFFTSQTKQTHTNRLVILTEIKHEYYKSVKLSALKSDKLLQSNGKNAFEDKSFLDLEWKRWKEDHNKVYSSPEEEQMRKKNFEANLQKQEEINENQGPFSISENSDMDLTPEEFAGSHLGLKQEMLEPSSLKNLQFTHSNEEIPKIVDWREVLNLKLRNQKCGDCWANAGVSNLEALYKIQENKDAEFSIQQFIETNENGCGYNGCNGGFPYKVLELAANVGVLLEEDFPYLKDKNEVFSDKQALYDQHYSMEKPEWEETCPISRNFNKVNSGYQLIGSKISNYIEYSEILQEVERLDRIELNSYKDYLFRMDKKVELYNRWKEVWRKIESEGDENCDDFKRAVAKMPVSVGIFVNITNSPMDMKPFVPRNTRHSDADGQTVIKEQMGNHAVLLVGYTPNYWIIQNSWGRYSEKGYQYLAMGNTLGICQFGAFPTEISALKLKPKYQEMKIDGIPYLNGRKFKIFSNDFWKLNLQNHVGQKLDEINTEYFVMPEQRKNSEEREHDAHDFYNAISIYFVEKNTQDEKYEETKVFEIIFEYNQKNQLESTNLNDHTILLLSCGEFERCDEEKGEQYYVLLHENDDGDQNYLYLELQI